MASTTKNNELKNALVLKKFLIKIGDNNKIWLVPLEGTHSKEEDNFETTNEIDVKEEVVGMEVESGKINDVKVEETNDLTQNNMYFESRFEKNYTTDSRKDHIEDVKNLFAENMLHFEKLNFYQQISNELLEKSNPKNLEEFQNTYLQHLRELSDVELFKCSICPYETLNKQTLKSHLFVVHKSELEFKVFRCLSCEYKSKSMNCLKKHLSRHLGMQDDDAKGFENLKIKKPKKCTRLCDLCSFKTNNKESLEAHKITHQTEDGSQFKCHLCNFEHPSKIRLKKHLFSEHNIKTPGILKCDFCNYTSVSKRGLKNHSLSHKNPDEIQWFPCSECEFKTKFERNLKTHILVVHNPEQCVKKYLCEVCSRSFRSSTKLALHSLVHKDIKEVAEVFQCEQCSYKTKNKYNLKQHMQVHKSFNQMKTFVCDKCGLQCKRKWTYDYHLLTHKSENEVDLYCCDVCGFTTKFKDRLTKHLKIGTHSFKKGVSNGTSSFRKSNSKPADYKYNCSACNFETATRKVFHKHIETHENPEEIAKGCFVCETCGFRTRHKPGLTQHLMIHKEPEDVPTFRCPQPGCDHQTRFRSNLITHVKLTHKDPSQLTIYKCDACDFQSKRKWNYRTHLLTHKSLSEGESFKCSFCSYETKIKDYLRAHLKKRHNIVNSRRAK